MTLRADHNATGQQEQMHAGMPVSSANAVHSQSTLNESPGKITPRRTLSRVGWLSLAAAAGTGRPAPQKQCKCTSSCNQDNCSLLHESAEQPSLMQEVHTIARQQDENEGRLDAEHLLANVDSLPEGVLHCHVAALMPHRLWHLFADVSDATLGTLIQQVDDELLC